jgi:hypothetical protein
MRGQRHRDLGEGVLEESAPPGEGVERGRGGPRVPVASETIGASGVEGDEENVVAGQRAAAAVATAPRDGEEDEDKERADGGASPSHVSVQPRAYDSTLVPPAAEALSGEAVRRMRVRMTNLSLV